MGGMKETWGQRVLDIEGEWLKLWTVSTYEVVDQL